MRGPRICFPRARTARRRALLPAPGRVLDLRTATFRPRELYERYHKGMEDQLGALGLVLNCVVLWNTRYMNAALDELRAQGHPVRDEDITRLSPFVRHHLNVHGKYSFVLPELPAGLRAVRNPNDDQDGEHE